MNVQPEVSVLLPVYDGEDTLGSCLQSLVRQSMSNWECILVDDGSRDRSIEVARHFAGRDARIRLVESEHRGLVSALRLGLDECRAAHVARMDADDWMHRDRLKAQLDALVADPELAAVGCHVRIFPRVRSSAASERSLPGESDHRRTGRLAYEAWLNQIRSAREVAVEAYVECPIAHPTLFIRRATLERFGYRDCNWPEDYDLVLRMLGAGERIAVVPRRLLGWRDDPRRLSRQSPRYDLERFVACKAAHLAKTLLADSREYILWGYGGTGRAMRSALAEYARFPSHIIDLHPRRIGQHIHGAPVHHPDDLSHLPRRPIVASVAGAQPRAEIREALASLDLEEGCDFVCAA